MNPDPMLSPAERLTIAARRAAASIGPMYFVDCSHECGDALSNSHYPHYAVIGPYEDDDRDCIAFGRGESVDGIDELEENNFRFMAAAFEDVPRLLITINVLEAERNEAREMVTKLRAEIMACMDERAKFQEQILKEITEIKTVITSCSR